MPIIAPMTKAEMALYRRRRKRILRMAKRISQAEIARRLGMKRQRVNQIITDAT